jgi:5-methylcytosine-specific restriction enzyme B
MNVKQDFLKWFIKRDTYKGLPETSIKRFVDEYVVFLDFDPFEVNDDFSNIEEIKAKIADRSGVLRKTNPEYVDFQRRSSSNAPLAILGKNNYSVFLDELKNQSKKRMMDLSAILNQPEIQTIINEPDFYFQKGQDAFKKWNGYELSDNIKEKLELLSDDYEKLQEEANTNPELKKILSLFFEIISYCDSKAKDKHFYNQYEDKRTLAFAYVRMNIWVKRLIQWKRMLYGIPNGSPLNAFEYLILPEKNATILSENHRQLLSENLFKKPYVKKDFVEYLISFFKDYNLQVTNPQNYTHLLSRIVYFIEDKWKEEVIGLMASDGTGWQDVFIQNMKEHDAAIIWNSKRPSGTDETLNFLRTIIKESESFNLYYNIGGKVYFKATVIDFVENQKELDSKKWNTKFGKLYDYQSNFVDYTDNIKSANIVFLVKTLEKIEPISVSEFKFYKNYKVPVQDNLSPIKTEPENFNVIESKPEIKQKYLTDTKYPLNQILFGPPGTGKTFNTVNKAIAIAHPDFNLNQSRDIIKQEFDRLMNEGQIVFTTFHQSMSYEDFIEGIKPLKPEVSDGFVKYDVVHGIFKRLCRKAETPPNISFDIAYKKLLTDLEEKDEIEVKNPKVSYKIKASENGEDLGVISNSYIKNITKEGLVYVSKSNRYAGTWGQYYKAFFQLLKDKYGYKESANTELKNHVIIIDEINRGNISQIFGELITLIEEDKRLGKDEALEVTLPYSKEKFGVPANLYIIGTMNTADRSVEALDTALRRRFSFVEILPDSALIATDGKLKDKQGILNGIDLPLLLDTINKRIVKLLDKDHQIGHSYFMTVTNLDDLKIVFHNKIIPLLQEYFFGDYGKAGLVLGEEFFEPREEQNDNLFADFNGYDASEFAERPIYKVKNIANMSDSNFIKAINTLLKK